MELKPYQQKVITDLENYLSYLEECSSPAQAFNEYWKDKLGEYTVKLDGSTTGMRPYKDTIPGAAHIAIKVPTSGGKTFIACNALKSINTYFNKGNPKAVVWLVPWSNLLQQTVGNLSNPSHPYREKLNTLFNGRVEVYGKEQLLQGANFNPSSVLEQLNIYVFNFSSLRINKANKEDRKIYQENGALESFADTLIDEEVVLEGTDRTALINVIRSLNPVVIVDESHNAESDLSVEMLNNLNPSLVLDLTATPKSNSNIISFVNAVELKKEHMVKLPVIVYNHNRKEEVISSALHLQRQLELLAQEEEKQKGKYIRPIILFQAQSNIKGKDNATFQNIKEKLIRLGIPEEQIKIKVSGIDELKGIDLTSKDCPVRYIITINALKEGWDCPNAYILASLADKSSAVDVEQILGRILRQPYVTQHSQTLLNLSFVLTASAKFKETLDKIVKGLQDSGFSKDDYYATDTQQEEELTNNDILKQELLSVDKPETTSSDEDFAIEKIEYIPLNDNGIVSKVTDKSIVQQISEKAIIEGKEFEKKLAITDEDDDTYLIQAMGGTVKTYKINEEYIDGNMKLPQFFKKSPVEDLNAILFEELKENEIFLSKNSLLDGFVLATQDTQIDFKISADIYQTDIDERTGTVKTEKIVTRGKELLLNAILNTPKEGQIKQVSSLIVRKLGDQSPISQQDLTKYVNKIFENIANTEQIRDIVTNVYIYIAKIKEKINKLTDVYSRESFNRLLDTNHIITKESWSFPKQVNLVEPSSPIIKSLYEQEEKMNQSEHKLIMEVAALENVKFWHRNLERKKGFFLNGYNKNHYPDFIICTEKNNLILLEVKGDHLNNEDSKNKNLLGKKWAEKAGEKYKYFMAFESVQVPDTYTFKTITEVIKSL